MDRWCVDDNPIFSIFARRVKRFRSRRKWFVMGVYVTELILSGIVGSLILSKYFFYFDRANILIKDRIMVVSILL